MDTTPGPVRIGRVRDHGASRIPSGPALLRGLLQPRAWPYESGTIRVVETHISWVLLVGDFAYKIKKPLKLHFLDYSTLELRRAACEEELRLNRRTAPELYLGVVPISGTPRAPRVEGAGPVIDYAVKMRRFPQSAQLDRRLESGALEAGELEAFAQDLAAFHESAALAGSGEADAATLAHAPLRETLLDLLAGAADDPLRTQRLRMLQDWSEREFRVLAPAFASRSRAGRVRECHGDLHLANLVRFDGRIVAFDAIEFSPSLRRCDVISDVAFLFMDLCTRGREDFAYAFVNAWLQATGDYAALPLLNYYLVYRALVRAKVASIRRDTAPPGERPVHDREVERYVAWAHARIRTRRPRLVLMHGVSGSGKTWISGRLLPLLPAIRVRSDVERKRLLGVAELGRTDRDAYRTRITDQVYARLARAAEAVLTAGENAIVDATFLERARRRVFLELARRLEVPCVIVHCSAPSSVLEQRVLARTRAANDASEADLKVLRRQSQVEERMDPTEGDAVFAVNADSDVEALARRALAISARSVPP